MTSHITRFSLVAALTLAPAVSAAQISPGAVQPDTRIGPGVFGLLDFGVRGTTAEGDAARYERYRDLGDGLFLEAAHLTRNSGSWSLELKGQHVGRQDQRLEASIGRQGLVNAWVRWDQIPMLMSGTTTTLFTAGSPEPLLIDDLLQAGAQAQPAALPTIFDQNSRQFRTETGRDAFTTGFEYLASQSWTLRGQARRMTRNGVIPYGGSFGHSSLVELPGPIDHTLNDFEGSAEYASGPLLVRGGYTGSWFRNDITQLAFDSPFRLTDTSATPAHGNLSQAPSNSFVGVNGMGTVKLKGRSRATAYVSFGSLKDAGDPLMPQTINTVNVTAPVERTAVEGEAKTSSVNLSFVSRPGRHLDYSVRYRTYDYDNRTPEFVLTQRVAYDNTPGVATMSSLGAETSTLVETEPFSVNRHNFDAEFGYTLQSGLRTAFGYTRLAEDRTHRVIDSNTEDAIRVTFDAVGNQWFTLRSRYEHANRKGTATEEEERELYRIGEQPGMRHMDVAARGRDRVTFLGTVTPAATWSLNATYATGKDDYTESEFGLRDNTHNVFGMGFDYAASEQVAFTGSVTIERYRALSRSRQANPPASNAQVSFDQYQVLSTTTGHGVQVADPARNWATDGFDRAENVTLGANLGRGKVNFDFTYDYSRARATYHYITGPVADRTLPEEVIVDSTLPPPTQLPDTLSEFHRGSMDFVYSLTSRVGIGLSAWYERYRVEDFTLDAEANPNQVRGSTVLLGYLYTPYTATTVWARMLYRW